MAELDLTQLRALTDAATPGPWTPVADKAGEFYRTEDNFDVHAGEEVIADGGPVEDGGPHVGACLRADAEFIAAARDAVPALLDEIDRLTRKLDAAEDTIGEMWRLHHRELILRGSIAAYLCCTCLCAWPCPTGAALALPEEGK